MSEQAQRHREQAQGLRDEANDLLRKADELDKAEAVRRTIELRPASPSVSAEAPAFVIFSKCGKYKPEHVHTYAAVGWIRATSFPIVRWTVTGIERRHFNWLGLLEWIGEKNWSTIQLVTVTTPLFTPPPMFNPIVDIVAAGPITTTYPGGSRTEPYHGKAGSRSGHPIDNDYEY